MKAICVGHSTYDITLQVDKFPKENEKYRTNKTIECGGGPASNAAYLLAKWKAETTIASILGNDHYADLIIEEFKKIGANTNFLEKAKDHKTSTSYVIANEENGSRTIITSKDKEINSLSKIPEEKYDIIVIDGEHYETALNILKNNKGAISILDAGRIKEHTKELGKLVTYVICSKTFAESFAEQEIDCNNMKSLEFCYDELKNYFNTNIIITLEEDGSFTRIKDKYIKIPTIKVKSIDTTGAGDIFHGAFAYFISKNYTLEDCIKYSSITAALSTTKLGGRTSIPSLEEVMNYDAL